ncbi:cytochrome P450 [Coprinellus micaceus]|uniref:Cytochrome P450 n=1 Tax=Coprinellus micaceus TaxID=71717 RepID=A0A4Y7SEW0_COPMI|nr:cytochrome P450 [Coprinellus micaceus]
MTATAEARDNIQIPPIKGQLTRLLDELVPEVHDEIKAAFDDEFPSGEEEWCSFVALPSIIKMVARISNRVLVGQSLCRNPEYITGCINYALEVFSMAYIISAFPEPIRPFVNRIISPIPRRIRSMTTFLQPLLDERRTKKGDKGDDYQPQAIFLNWLADTAEQREKDDREVVLRTMLVNFGSIHTTSMTFTHALFSVLSHPQYIAPLREEIELCIQEDGWTKPAIDRMRLLDSFLKESQRFDLMTILIGNRLAVEDCTISGTVIPKGTMVAANMVDAHFHPSMWGETADEFDPYRFIKLEEETGKVIKLPTSTLYTMTFGYGRHACPGRFFAGQEMKLLMAYFLHHYDLKLETKHGERPNNFWFGMGNVPNRSAKVLMRKRKEV